RTGSAACRRPVRALRSYSSECLRGCRLTDPRLGGGERRAERHAGDLTHEQCSPGREQNRGHTDHHCNTCYNTYFHSHDGGGEQHEVDVRNYWGVQLRYSGNLLLPHVSAEPRHPGEKRHDLVELPDHVKR